MPVSGNEPHRLHWRLWQTPFLIEEVLQKPFSPRWTQRATEKKQPIYFSVFLCGEQIMAGLDSKTSLLPRIQTNINPPALAGGC